MNSHVQRLLKKKVAFVGSESDGKPYVKAMIVSKREGVNVFYFDSNNGSQRVAQWQKNPNACLYFYSGLIYRGVMLSGKIEIINDMEQLEEQQPQTRHSSIPKAINDIPKNNTKELFDLFHNHPTQNLEL
jgi:general stress protein 26